MNCGKNVGVESDEHQQRRKLGPAFGIHAARHLRPPEVQSRHVGHHHAADHHVVEVGDHEVGVGDVHVETERGQEHAGQAANREQADEAERVQHRRLEANGALVQGRCPVEDLHRRGNGDQVAQQREHQRGVHRNSRDEHVMRPDQEAEHGDGDAEASATNS